MPTRVRPRSTAFVAGVVSLTLACGRDLAPPTAAAPTPVPTPRPSPSLPAGVPAATALANLPLVLSLERATARRSDLVAIQGFADDRGEVVAGRRWSYFFLERTEPPYAPYRRWDVAADGRLEYWEHHPADGSCYQLAPMPDRAPLDSPHIVGLAMRYARQYLKRHTGALFFQVTYTAGVGRPSATVTFWDASGSSLYGCRRDNLVIDAYDGAEARSALYCGTAGRNIPSCP